MSLEASCPRCTAPLDDGEKGLSCPAHGDVEPLWRPEKVDYESFAEVVGRARGLPIYLPWPMSPGWSISDVGCVAGTGPRATATTTVGVSDLDGEVEVSVVTEDPGVGLGGRVAGSRRTDPGDQVGTGLSAVRVRVDGRTVPMWVVDVDSDEFLTSSVFAGEADGRWLWLVLRPASAALLLQDEWLLADVAGFGPNALEMPFGGPRPSW